MIDKLFGGRRPRPAAGALRAWAADVVVQTGLVAAAWLLVVRLERGPVLVERALGVLTFAGGVAASILLLVAAWMSAHLAARRVAAAVALHTAVTLLLRAIAADASAGIWMLLVGASVFGVVGLLLLAIRGLAGTRREVDALVDRPLRRAGLAFSTIGVAHAIGLLGGPAAVGALELAAVAMFLVAAVPFLLAAVQQVWRQHEMSRTRLAEAEAVMASVAERDHEMRNVLAGLSGAASVLTGDGGPDGGRQLLAAAGSELARLQRMLDVDRPAAPSRAAVATVLRDLAVIHGASGMDVEVDVVDELWALIDPAGLAQVVANLLVNCARHAPGAAVRLRARQRGDRVRIEVVDDGPGLPAVPVLARGARGPRSTGHGLGLAITAELVRERGGSFALRSSGRGCTAEIELPVPAPLGVGA